MHAAHSESFVRRSKPSLALSSRPIGAIHGKPSGKYAYTVSRPFSSAAVVTTPRGLFSARYIFELSARGCPSISMRSFPRCTGVSGSRRTAPFHFTRPAAISSAARDREQWPSFESARASPTFLSKPASRFSLLVLRFTDGPYLFALRCACEVILPEWLAQAVPAPMLLSSKRAPRLRSTSALRASRLRSARPAIPLLLPVCN